MAWREKNEKCQEIEMREDQWDVEVCGKGPDFYQQESLCLKNISSVLQASNWVSHVYKWDPQEFNEWKKKVSRVMLTIWDYSTLPSSRSFLFSNNNQIWHCDILFKSCKKQRQLVIVEILWGHFAIFQSSLRFALWKKKKRQQRLLMLFFQLKRSFAKP